MRYFAGVYKFRQPFAEPRNVFPIYPFIVVALFIVDFESCGKFHFLNNLESSPVALLAYAFYGFPQQFSFWPIQVSRGPVHFYRRICGYAIIAENPYRIFEKLI